MSFIPRIKLHLDTQGRKALESGNFCAYRGADSTMCAVGCLIKDEFYEPYLEGDSIRQPDIQYAVEKSLGHPLTADHIQALDWLQQIHDNHWKPETETFSAAVDRFVLTYPDSQEVLNNVQ